MGGANVNATTHTGSTVSVTGAVTAASVVGGVITGSSVSVTGNITAGNLVLSGAIVDSAQLDIQTSAANANIVFTPNGTGNVNMTTGLSVTGNITGGNILGGANVNATTHTGTTVSVTGNITGGNILGVPVATNGIVVNSLTVATSYTIANGYSGTSAGPITISGGVVVTVSPGSRWVVI